MHPSCVAGVSYNTSTVVSISSCTVSKTRPAHLSTSPAPCTVHIALLHQACIGLTLRNHSEHTATVPMLSVNAVLARSSNPQSQLLQGNADTFPSTCRQSGNRQQRKARQQQQREHIIIWFICNLCIRSCNCHLLFTGANISATGTRQHTPSCTPVPVCNGRHHKCVGGSAHSS